MAEVTGMVVRHDKFDGAKFSDETALARLRLSRPDKLNQNLTYLQGRFDKKFPLTFLTEGQKGGLKNDLTINDIQYTWNTINRVRQSSAIIRHGYTTGDKPGLNGSKIYLVMADEWLNKQHTVRTPNGTQLRVDDRRQVADGFEYTFQLITRSRSAYVALTEITVGNRLSMIGAPAVSESHSFGNESNRMGPGEMTNQISILRKSQTFGGNIANKEVAEVIFNIPGKGNTSMWMPWEEWLFELEVKQAVEEHLWTSQYNRLADGTILNTDPDNGLPVPYGAGVDYQIPNKDTYGELTMNKLSTTVGDIFYGDSDTEAMTVVLYTGVGGRREFHDAIMSQAGGFVTLLSGDAAKHFVKESGSGLQFGAYFDVYKHVDGHVIILKTLNLLDEGGIAENAPKHPKTGLPITSYDMFFVDMSTYGGERNVRMVSQKGRSLVRGILKGMAPAPDHFKWTGNEVIATDQDRTELHILMTRGICIKKNTHCFKLSCNLS